MNSPIEPPINFSVDGPDFDLDLIRSDEKKLEALLEDVVVHVSAIVHRNPGWRANAVDVLPIKDLRVGNTESIRFLSFQFTRSKSQLP